MEKNEPESEIMKPKLVKETFLLKLGPDLERELPLINLSGTDKRIASFVMLGDVELNAKCAALLVDQMKSRDLLDKFDILVALEAKGIALTHECARLLNLPYYARAPNPCSERARCGTD